MKKLHVFVALAALALLLAGCDWSPGAVGATNDTDNDTLVEDIFDDEDDDMVNVTDDEWDDNDSGLWEY